MRIFSTSMTCAVSAAVLGLVSPLGANRAPAAGGHAIVGAWTLNHDLSDQPGRDQRDGGASGGRRAGGRGPGGGEGGVAAEGLAAATAAAAAVEEAAPR
jgi:hypothetical protein